MSCSRVYLLCEQTVLNYSFGLFVNLPSLRVDGGGSRGGREPPLSYFIQKINKGILKLIVEVILRITSIKKE